MIQGCSSEGTYVSPLSPPGSPLSPPGSPLPPTGCQGPGIGFLLNGERCWTPGTLLSSYPQWGFHGGRDTFGIWGVNGGIWGREEERSRIDITFIPLKALDTLSWPILVKIAQASFFYNGVSYTRIDSTSWGEITSVGEHGVSGRFEARLYDSTGRLMMDLRNGYF